MTMEVALRYPRVLAGCVGVSGYLHEPEQALRELSPVARQQKTLFTLGSFDSLIPAEKVKGQLHLLHEEAPEAAPAPKRLAERRSRSYAPSVQSVAPQVVTPGVAPQVVAPPAKVQVVVLQVAVLLPVAPRPAGKVE